MIHQVTSDRGRQRHLGPFLLAVLVSATLVLSAPFVGQIRSFVRQQFPGRFVLVIGGVCLAGLAVALSFAIWRIRDRRRMRYGAILVAIAIAWGWSAATASRFPESNAVEHFHFLQYGLITFLFYRAWRPAGDASVLILPLLAGLIAAAADEWLQWLIPNRVGEMRDVVLNGVAMICGLLFSIAADPPLRFSALSSGSRRRISRLAAIALIVFAAFIHTVHLGSVIEDAETGRFDSRYTKTELLVLQQERAALWRTTPPSTTIHRLSREDQYLTEGVQHARERNRRWEAGDAHGAWVENRILETYYQPVLDTATPEGPGHRWPAAQRADAASRNGAGSASDFVSRAYPYPILTWRPSLFWLCIIALALAIVAGGNPRWGRPSREDPEGAPEL